ncbi:DUF4148 domain-containing protein [Methylibium sp.]|uniref:DUF4148 domain-containing protein n=1 Tax=Methylibium sp. TaxID=2067992 RepID=UPI00286B1C0A|nr:DUF4148 domain-containing protein [Methylibium sp.]
MATLAIVAAAAETQGRPSTRAEVTAELMRARQVGELDFVLIEVLRPAPHRLAQAAASASAAQPANASALPETRQVLSSDRR